jgi:16S rRNA C1402 N4-methylase RsmH
MMRITTKEFDVGSCTERMTDLLKTNTTRRTPSANYLFIITSHHLEDRIAKSPHQNITHHDDEPRLTPLDTLAQLSKSKHSLRNRENSKKRVIFSLNG